MKKPNILILSVIIFSLFSCKGEGLHKEFSYGEFSNQKYINEFFQIKLDIPNTWTVASKDDRDELFENLEIDQTLNKKERELFKKNKHRNAYIFLAHKYNPNTFQGPVNPTFHIAVERVDDNKFVRNAEDYMKLARKTSRMTSDIKQEITKTARVKLGGNEFERHVIKQKFDVIEYEITQFCEILNGYAVVYSLIYSSEEDRRQLVKCLSSLKHIL
ncbi:MAG: hypothetical protein WED10_08420 [Brumimicrobium sp.]